MSRILSARIAGLTILAVVLTLLSLALEPGVARAVQYPPGATTTTVPGGGGTTTTVPGGGGGGATTTVPGGGGATTTVPGGGGAATTTTIRAAGTLPRTGNNSLIPLVQLAAVLAVAGLLLILVERNRRAARAGDEG